MNSDTNFIRTLNGYRLLYLPNHPKAMHNEGWEGYVYEHIVVAGESLGRELTNEEVVHHLDGNRANNRRINLLVLLRGQHSKLHLWLSAGAPMCENLRKNGEDSLKAKFDLPQFCLCCGRTLQNKQKQYCSAQCAHTSSRKVIRPTKQELLQDTQCMPIVKVGKKYGVSDNAIRKWLRSYQIDKLTMSRAKVTTLEGAETTGKVQPF